MYIYLPYIFDHWSHQLAFCIIDVLKMSTLSLPFWFTKLVSTCNLSSDIQITRCLSKNCVFMIRHLLKLSITCFTKKVVLTEHAVRNWAWLLCKGFKEQGRLSKQSKEHKKDCWKNVWNFIMTLSHDVTNLPLT